MTKTTNKLTGKDLINIGIYTVIYFVIMMLVGWLSLWRKKIQQKEGKRL